MAKSAVTQPAPKTADEAATQGTPNEAAPKKKRNKGVKYTNIVESAYQAPKDGEAQSPLDRKALAVKGGLKFPGVVFERTIFGVIVKIPAKATAIKEPTIRQLVAVLEDLYKV